MNTSTDDRRVRKTKKTLREGLAELMMEKDLRNITVRELVDTVDLHRATFYAHYKDIYDLYEQMENGVVEELVTIVDDPSLTDESFFEVLIDYIYDNAKLCRMLLNKNGTRSFLDRISTVLEEKYIAMLIDETKKNEVSEEWKCFACYHIRGCLAIISHWAEHDFVHPKEKLVDMIMKVDKNFYALLLI